MLIFSGNDRPDGPDPVLKLHLVHSAAASNLGQMLIRICQEGDIALVYIVRKAEHVELLSNVGCFAIVIH